jgi:hypothetical protein
MEWWHMWCGMVVGQFLASENKVSRLFDLIRWKENGDGERRKMKMLLVVGMIKVCGKD